MREIEFRGKASTGIWVVGDLIQYKSGAVAILKERFSNYGYEASELLGRVAVDPETVGQYTGLKDKNEQKIYEGDIVKLKGKEPWIVVWLEEWCLQSYDGFLELIDYPSEDLEVIGNIHDNPELLKECGTNEK